MGADYDAAIKFIPASLNRQVRDFLIENVHFRYDHELLVKNSSAAALLLTSAGYTLIVGDKYATSSEEEQIFILLHEIAHLIRGDCLSAAKQKLSRQDCVLWNIAADACINSGLSKELVMVFNGIWYYDLIKQFENALPKTWLPATSEIFMALKNSAPEFSGFVSAADNLSYDEGIDTPSLRKAHARALLAAREVLKEVTGLEALFSGIWFELNTSVGRRRINAEDYPLPLASIILKHLAGKNFGARAHRRTFVREGRVDGLRGSALLPRIKILAAIDVSGSCSHLVERFVGASKWLAKRHSVELIAFDTCVYKYGPEVAVGGGTMFAPVYAYAETKKYDALIMLSDGCAGDIKPLPPMPTIWIVPKNHDTIPLRYHDKKIVLDGGADNDNN